MTAADLMLLRQRAEAVIAEARAFYPPAGVCAPKRTCASPDAPICTCKLADALDAYDRVRREPDDIGRWLMTTEEFDRASYVVMQNAVNDAIVSAFWRGVCAERARALESIGAELAESGCLDESCRAASLALDHRAWTDQ